MNFRNSLALRGPAISKRRGFTLVEVFLVAMLSGVILTTILSSFVGGIRIWKTVKDSELLADRKFHISIAKIDRELRSYIRNFDEIYFEGNDKEISFSTLSGLDIVKITYSFNKGRKSLVRKKVKHSNSLKDEMNEEVTNLFSADNVEFSYLLAEPSEESDMIGWVTAFSEEDGIMPLAVRLNIKRKGRELSKDVFISQ